MNGLELRSRALSAVDLTKRYGAHVALSNVSLEVKAGTFQALLGPSGSGKTSLLLSIAGFLKPDAGAIKIDGREITTLAPEHRNFGMVFQGYALFPHLTVLDNVAFPLRARGLAPAERKKRALSAIELVRLNGLEDRYPKQLSGGQQQRVALARAISFQPDLLLLDEPLSALDRALRADLQVELKSLQQKTGLTCVYVTHDQDEALSMADTVAILTNGQIVQNGPPATLYEKPATKFVASFLGRSNFLNTRLVEKDGKLKYVDGKGVEILHSSEIGIGGRSGASATLTLRPEKIRIAPTGSDLNNVVDAVVTSASYFGSHFDFTALTEGLGELHARASSLNGSKIAVGDHIKLGWDASDTVEVLG